MIVPRGEGSLFVSTAKQHCLKVYLAGLENSRDQIDDLVLFVEGSGPVLRPIHLKPDLGCYELMLPAGMYHLRVKFTIGRKTFKRSLSAIKVPPAVSVRFDLAQAITDAIAGAIGPSRKVSHRAAAWTAGA